MHTDRVESEMKLYKQVSICSEYSYGAGELSVFCQSCILIKNPDWPGSMYRRVNQTGSRGRAMRNGEGKEGGSPFFIPAQTTEKQIVTCPTGKGTEPHK